MKKSAFTLIELLIVIAIVAVLSGVLISVINPKRQQEKAKDAVIISNMEKVIVSVEAYKSAFSDLPTCEKLASEELKNASAATGCTNSPSMGAFTVSGVNTYDGNFYYAIETDSTGTYPYLYAQSFKNNGNSYVCYRPIRSSDNGGRVRLSSSPECILDFLD